MASAFLRAVNAGWFDGYCISRKIVKIILIFMFELIIVQGMPLGDLFLAKPSAQLAVPRPSRLNSFFVPFSIWQAIGTGDMSKKIL